MIGERNSEDSRRKSLACRDGARRRVAERGRQQGMAPFGYGLNDDGDLVPRDDQAAVVRRIFAAYLGGAGTGRIAADLTREGVRPPRAETWDRSQISNMLRSPVYVGKVHSNGEVFDGQHEAIVSAADWERAQRLRAAKRASATGGRGKLPSGSHLLTLGLLRCGSCGGAMSPRTYRHRPGLEVYLCSTRRKTGGSEVCQQPSVGRELVDSAVLRHFAAVGLDEEQTLARLREHGDLRLTEARAAREQAEVEASKAAAGVERVRRYVREGRLEPEELREAKAEAEAAQARVALLLEREGEAERDAAARDVEAEALSAVTHVRSVIAGQIGAAGEVDAVRAALTEIFSAFVLRRVDQAPSYVAVWPELAAGEYFVEPIIRPEAALGSAWVMPDLADFGSPDEPVRLEDALRLGITGTVEYDGDELPLRRVPLALPGGDSTSALSRGANDLLRLGATPLTGSDDVLELFGLEQAQAEAVDLSEPADKVLARLRDAPASADELVRATGLDAGSLASALTELELAGVVVAAGGLFRAD
jgi:hypothetical protein